MSAEQIFRLALEEMATGGNETAKVALAFASSFPGIVLAKQSPAPAQVIPAADISNILRGVQTELNRALYENDLRWACATDEHIKKAQKAITEALIKLGPQ